MEYLSYRLSELVASIQKYYDLKVLFIKLRLIDIISNLFSHFILLVFVFLFMFFFFLLGSIGLSIFIGQLIGSIWLGFMIVSALFLLTVFVIYFLRVHCFQIPIIKYLNKLFISENEKNQ